MWGHAEVTMARRIFNGRGCDEDVDIMEVIGELHAQREYLHSLQTDHLIEYLDRLGRSWASDKDLRQRVPYNLTHLSEFMSEGRLRSMMDIALRDRRAMDGFVEIGASSLLYHAQPRGIAVHWLAGNVPILGIFSLIQTILTKNVSLLKASSGAYKELVALLDTFAAFSTEHVNGAEIAQTIQAVLVDNADRKTHETLSMHADIRIAWGGHDAIEAITRLPKRFFCEDIVYGPKYSYAFLDAQNQTRQALARLAFDVSTFDQYACSSPHTLFVEGSLEDAQRVAQTMAQELENVNRLMLPKGPTDPGKTMDILRVRTEYAMKGKVFSSRGTEWTVVVSDEESLAEACFSRVIFVRPVSGPGKLRQLNDRRKQTLGIGIMDRAARERFVDSVTLYGIDRCPQFGNMTLFESPWDGMFAIDRMVRWVTTWRS